MGSCIWEFRGRSLELCSGTSVLALDGSAWVCVCIAAVFACACLFTQWDAAEAKLCVLIGCAFHEQRFCLSLLLHHSPSLRYMASSAPQNDRTGGKTGSNFL